jgi:hypothetical protein
MPRSPTNHPEGGTAAPGPSRIPEISRLQVEPTHSRFQLKLPGNVADTPVGGNTRGERIARG